MTKLTVPIATQSVVQGREQIAAARAGGAQMIELRLDYLTDLTAAGVGELVAAAKAGESLPVIATCRDGREGGVNDWPVDRRLGALAAAVGAGADFVDFEYENYRVAENKAAIDEMVGEGGVRLILSAHDFSGRFADIGQLRGDMAAQCGGAIAKLVYTADDVSDCFEAFDLLHGDEGELIALCMGQAGVVSRIIAAKLGSAVTFASIDSDAATAPGQLTIDSLRGLYRCDVIDSQTELFGVIADPVGHSMSPVIHNACFGDMEMNRLYLPLLVRGDKAGFDAFMDGVLERRWLDFKGFSVTIPHKGNALEYVRAKGGTIEPLAEKIGAVNTIIIEDDGGLSAYNTDYAAALDAVTDTLGITRAGLSALAVAVVGAGGVSRALVAGLTDAGAKVKIYNRTVAKAEALAGEFGCEYAGLDGLSGLDAKLIVNCTSIGMHPNVESSPVPAECIKADMAVFDTVYNPVQTLLLKHAAAAGAKTIDGVTMFVNQAMAQFKFFTGRDGNAELMRRTVLEQLGQ